MKLLLCVSFLAPKSKLSLALLAVARMRCGLCFSDAEVPYTNPRTRI
jgi:hypothetical protein